MAVSPLLVGNLVETRFDLALAAILVWTIWAAVTGRFVLMWGLLAAAILLKLVPLAADPGVRDLAAPPGGHAPGPGRRRREPAVVVAVMAPFVILSPSGTWHLAAYHLDRPLQLESIGASYLLGLHALADIPVTVESSFGSQGIDGTGPAVISAISTAVLAV